MGLEMGLDEIRGAIAVEPVEPIGVADAVSGSAPASASAATANAHASADAPSASEPVAWSLPESTVESIADDSATLSLAGRLISAASETSSVRFDRVASLRESIEAGTYDVSSDAVADAVMREMLRS